MPGPPPNHDLFDALLQRMCDERLTEADQVQLVKLLHESASARRRYLEFVHLSVSLADWSLSVLPGPDRNADGDDSSLSPYPNIEITEPRHAPANQPMSEPLVVPTRRRREISLGVVLAASVLLAVGIGAISGMFSWQDEIAQEPSVVLPPVTTVDHEMFIARVVEITADADWDVERMPREFLMRLRAGEELHLESGLAKIEFYSGARLILHGPATFEPTGHSSAYLHEGRVSGRVDSGDFLLVTPTAEVLDIGTEFGVSVGPSSDTDVLVFDGEVNVRPDHVDPRIAAESVNLTEGMTVRVSEDGRMAGASFLDIDKFSRRFAELAAPTEASSELSLVDILCGGSGRGQRLAAAIDPLTGDWDRVGWQKPFSPGTRRGNTDFHASQRHPMIDGAFIPSSTGAPTQVDSIGRTITLPLAHGAYTWGPVWARRFSKDLTIPPSKDVNDFWGADTFPVISHRLADSRYGGIGIHASVGITFNLQDVRDLHFAEIDFFEAVLTNLDNSEAHNPEYAKANVRSANFFVVVDGEVRYEQLNFRRNVEGVEFEVPINREDRMLTLISTDANNSNKYDHIVLIDPVLNLHPDPKVLQTQRAKALLSSSYH